MSVAGMSTATDQKTLGQSRIQSMISEKDSGMPEDWEPKLGAFLTDEGEGAPEDAPEERK